MTAALFDSSRMENGTHGNVQAWIGEVYAEAGVAGVAKAIAGWKTAFVGSKGVYVGVAENEAILVARIDLTEEEVEQASRP
jgi:hypothetical protein